jgi:hypothetical protein
LENYRTQESNGVGDDRHALQHNWVDEIARSEVRTGVGGGNDVNINTTTIAGITVFKDQVAFGRRTEKHNIRLIQEQTEHTSPVVLIFLTLILFVLIPSLCIRFTSILLDRRVATSPLARMSGLQSV